MRNQSWTKTGTLVRDMEYFVSGDLLMVTNHLMGKTRVASQSEVNMYQAATTPPRNLAAELDVLKAEVETLKQAQVVK